jgi:quercetin dioxygenase-like cupin family protein
MLSVLSTLAGFGVTGTSVAQDVQRDFAASPDVYVVRGENDQYRIVQATWKPGQRDQFHSHPAMLWVWVTDCSFRVYFPDGTSQNHKVAAGEAGFQAPITSHSLENLGTSECKIVMFESK